jgi:Uma2 family endonuclease
MNAPIHHPPHVPVTPAAPVVQGPPPLPDDRPTEWPHCEVWQDLKELDKLLVAEDNENMDSHWHALAMYLLIESINWHFRGRDDFHVGGNNFIYFSEEQARNKDYRGPDFYFINNVSRFPMRRYWCSWHENGRLPDVIIELSSPTTTDQDHGKKKAIYEGIFRTPEYYCYDPDGCRLEGWHLGPESKYEAIAPDPRGWLWCEQLQLWLGTWKGAFQGFDMTWLRFYHPDGSLVQVGAEEEAARAKAADNQAEVARQRLDAQRQRAEAEKQRAEAEKQRADALAAEVARLRAQLEQPKD